MKFMDIGHMENIVRGSHYTVLEGPICREQESLGPFGQMIHIPAQRDDSMRGMVFKVTAIDLPFIAVVGLNGVYQGVKALIDLRTGISLKETSEEMVSVLTNQDKHNVSHGPGHFGHGIIMEEGDE